MTSEWPTVDLQRNPLGGDPLGQFRSLSADWPATEYVQTLLRDVLQSYTQLISETFETLGEIFSLNLPLDDVETQFTFIRSRANRTKQLINQNLPSNVTKQEERAASEIIDIFSSQFGIIRRLSDSIFRTYIEEKRHPKLSLLSPEEKWQELERFARENGGVGVALYGRILFPDHTIGQSSAPSETVLPNLAPATWKNDKQSGETPPAFVKRVYGEWLGNGFTRATVRHLDPPLTQAITNWLRHNEWPADVDLPTLKEQNTRWVERVEREGLAAVIPDGASSAVLREARRLTAAKERRRDTLNK